MLPEPELKHLPEPKPETGSSYSESSESEAGPVHKLSLEPETELESSY